MLLPLVLVTYIKNVGSYLAKLLVIWGVRNGNSIFKMTQNPY